MHSVVVYSFLKGFEHSFWFYRRIFRDVAHLVANTLVLNKCLKSHRPCTRFFFSSRSVTPYPYWCKIQELVRMLLVKQRHTDTEPLNKTENELKQAAATFPLFNISFLLLLLNYPYIVESLLPLFRIMCAITLSWWSITTTTYSNGEFSLTLLWRHALLCT